MSCSKRATRSNTEAVFRLSTAIAPRRYKLLFAPHPAEGIFAGSAVITVEIVTPQSDPSSVLMLHALDLFIEAKHVTLCLVGDNKETRTCISVTTCDTDETISLGFDGFLPNTIGATFVLYITQFTGKIHPIGFSRGLFFSKKNDLNSLATVLQPTDARRLFPCFDEPSFRAVFELTVEFDSRYTVVGGTLPAREELVQIDETKLASIIASDPVRTCAPSLAPCRGVSLGLNGMIPDTEDAECQPPHGIVSDAKCGIGVKCESSNCSIRRITFHETPVLSPCMIGFTTGTFHVLEKEANRHQLLCRVIFSSDEQANQGWYALDLLTKAVDFFEDFFDFPLPLQKLDLVGLQEFESMGIEIWGTITLLHEYLFVDETTPVERRQRIARLIAHEVAHQWVGLWAPVAWWKYTWIKEGLCRYLEFVFVDALFPNWLMWDEFIISIFDDALAIDALPEMTHPVEYCNEDPRRIFGNFDTLCYAKGSSILRMLFSILGPGGLQETFRRLLCRGAKELLDASLLLDCISSKMEDPELDEAAKVVLKYTERSGHPLLYVEQTGEGYVVTQYHMPDLRDGIQSMYAEMQQSRKGPDAVDLTAPRRAHTFHWDPHKFLRSSDFLIPVSVVEVQRGSSSLSATFRMCKGRETLVTEPDSVVYLNYRGSCVLRCDYDTKTWLRIFEIAPFLSSEDRTMITVTLFRFRNIHIGVDSENGPDRCTLLLQWLLFITQSTFINSSQWTYITEHIEYIVYLVRDCHFRNIFSDFVCALYAPLLTRGAVSFAAQEKTVSFESQTNVSRQTVLHILQVLSICRCPMIFEESKLLVDWVLLSVIPSHAASRSASAYRAVPFDVDNDLEATAASIAMQCLIERGDSNSWWPLACLFGALLGFCMESLAASMHCDVIETQISHLTVEQEHRWLNIMAPAIFAYDERRAMKFLIIALGRFTNVNTPIAKAILRNKRLVTMLFERSCLVLVVPHLLTIRRTLIIHAAAFCGDGNLFALMKACMTEDLQFENKDVKNECTTQGGMHATVPSETLFSIAKSADVMEANRVWVDYCSDHYYNFLSMKHASSAWSMPNPGSPNSSGDSKVKECKWVSI